MLHNATRQQHCSRPKNKNISLLTFFKYSLYCSLVGAPDGYLNTEEKIKKYSQNELNILDPQKVPVLTLKRLNSTYQN